MCLLEDTTMGDIWITATCLDCNEFDEGVEWYAYDRLERLRLHHEGETGHTVVVHAFEESKLVEHGGTMEWFLDRHGEGTEWVCPDCGRTATPADPIRRCPECDEPWYETVP